MLNFVERGKMPIIIITKLNLKKGKPGHKLDWQRAYLKIIHIKYADNSLLKMSLLVEL